VQADGPVAVAALVFNGETVGKKVGTPATLTAAFDASGLLL
jgi:hypothetical protein